MSVLLLAAIATPGGLAAFLLSRRPRFAALVGALTALLAVVVAATIDPEDTVPLAGSVVAGSDGLRTLAMTWASGLLLIGTADVLVGTGGLVFGPALMALGTGVLALSVADAGVGFALLTAGGVGAALGPLVALPTSGADAALLGRRFLRPLVGAGLIALAAVAWSASSVGPFAAIDPLGEVDPLFEAALGVGLLAVVGAVLIRLGAIPIHVWAARFSESMPAAIVPSVLGWGAAGFALVALGWIDVAVSPVGSALTPERGVIAIVAAASILLGGTAAILHDDLEHILGYSIIQDAGVTLLAFASLQPEAAAAGRDWLVGMVAVKTGLAAWVLVTKATFGVRHLGELRGWARSAPILGVTLAIVLLGAVGLPGMATFDARATLTSEALTPPFDAFVLVAAFAPLFYLGRVLIVGVDRMSDAVRGARDVNPSLRGVRPGGWTTVDARALVRAVPNALARNRFAIAASLALVTAAIGLAVATAGLGAAASERPLGGEPGAEPSVPLETGL